MRRFLSEYFGRDNGRTAVIYHNTHGYEVEFLEHGERKDFRLLYEHSRDYVEDAAENWVEGIIE